MIDWTGKMWHIYTMEYHAAIKNNEFASFVGTWSNRENIILSKLTQDQKMKYHIFSLTDMLRNHMQGLLQTVLSMVHRTRKIFEGRTVEELRQGLWYTL
uniref:Uncharacterized protein n=1 Tax=Callithrix jacchus TaxID=9483 RepID=A0A8I3WVT9_CALJA